MTEIAELQTQIETAIRDLGESHKRAAKTVVSLKKKITDLELSISDESCAKTDASLERLNSATERLDRFIDSVILENAQALSEYDRLERECRALTFESGRLEDLKALCQENEQLAKDLLCYSLGHIRLKEREVKKARERSFSAKVSERVRQEKSKRLGSPMHTFSIVARDPKTGEMGVAVQSHWFSVGVSVPWAEAGIGAVATQSFVDPSYGLKGLDLMRSGKSAPESLRELIAADSGEAVRQVAMVDAKGRVSVHTGKRCIQCAGHKTGDGYSVQANLMLNDRVPATMAKAFEEAQGDLAERIMMALEAAQEVGGDIRGKQSAAMIVVKAQSSGKPWVDRVVDLRVEDHPEPLKELRRLLKLMRAYNHMNAGDAAMEKNDVARAVEEYGTAMKLAGDNLEIAFWSAFTMAVKGKVDQAVPIFREVFAVDKNWVEVLKRLPRAGLISDSDSDRALILRILKESGAC